MSGELAERIAQSVARATTPNEMVFGEVWGEREVRIGFAPGHYHRASTVQMAGDLTKLARLLFVAARKEHNAQLMAYAGRLPEGRPALLSGRDAEYFGGLDALVVTGVSDDGSVSVTATGQQHYAVEIQPGALDRLSEEQFCWAVGQAANRLIATTEREARALRWRVYADAV